ncbi:hypothetical protein JHK85_019107 [Glycine max]|nr:hypothetical protein JHK85_019107 [Glycine max]KAG5037855.1 hypothetical protein JHK86_018695 [Glycine max]
MLLHLKDNLVFNPATSKKLVHWNHSGNCCQWNGVTCSMGHVIGLDLSEEFISGGLNNSSLFKLKYLQNLNPAYNDFNSSIPLEFDKLKSLRLRNPNIGMFLQNLTKLTELYLNGVRVSAEGKKWCHALSSLQKLKVLNIPEQEFFANFSNLNVLELSSCRLSGHFPNDIFQMQTLSVIDISNNRDLHGVLPNFLQHAILHTMNLSNKFLGEITSFNDFIPVCLMERNSTLRVLNLTGNKLKGYLSDTTSSSCNSRSNKLNGPIACPHNTSSWEMLHIVDLDYNNFIGILPGPFFKSWTKMIGREAENHEKYGTLLFDMFDNLENMRYNNLLSVINKFLVTKLYKLLATEPYSVADHMFAYYITNNEFGGRYLDSVTVVNKALQMNFIKIPTITSMDLSSYHFEGPKSQEVVSLRALNALNLSHNAFSSHIPSSIGNLIYLESLDLLNNNLSGEIPL